MAKAAQQCIRYKMTFSEKLVREPLAPALSQFDVIHNILRGSITPKGATLDEIELIGSAKNIEKALKYLADKGVRVTKLD
jgi:hypothetical protein